MDDRIWFIFFAIVFGTGFLSLAYAGGKNNIPTVQKDIAVVMPGQTIWEIVSRGFPEREPP